METKRSRCRTSMPSFLRSYTLVIFIFSSFCGKYYGKIFSTFLYGTVRGKLSSQRIFTSQVIRYASSSTVFNFDEESKFMILAIQEAEKGLGKTHPNPSVGCVIVDANGEIVGKGFHPKAGQPHAEVFALREAGSKAEGGTAYVTLEPCNSFGRTPPCVDALLKAKVRRVVAGMIDPDPRTAGNGLKRLSENGIEAVELSKESALAEACQKICAPFSHRILHKSLYGVAFCKLHLGELECITDEDVVCAHPDFKAFDGILVEGVEGVNFLERCESKGLLPESFVRGIIAEHEDVLEEALRYKQIMNKNAQHILICTSEALCTQLASDIQPEFEVFNTKTLNTQETSQYFLNFGLNSMVWVCQKKFTKQVLQSQLLQKIFIQPSNMEQSNRTTSIQQQCKEVQKHFSEVVGHSSCLNLSVSAGESQRFCEVTIQKER